MQPSGDGHRMWCHDGRRVPQVVFVWQLSAVRGSPQASPQLRQQQQQPQPQQPQQPCTPAGQGRRRGPQGLNPWNVAYACDMLDQDKNTLNQAVSRSAWGMGYLSVAHQKHTKSSEKHHVNAHEVTLKAPIKVPKETVVSHGRSHAHPPHAVRQASSVLLKQHLPTTRRPHLPPSTLLSIHTAP